MSDLIYKVGNEFAPYHPSASHVDPRHRDGWNACWIAASAEIERLTAERDELRRQLAEAERDARRYRWLREHVDGDRWYLYYDDCGRDLLQGDALDAAIDAAMGLTRPAEES